METKENKKPNTQKIITYGSYEDLKDTIHIPSFQRNINPEAVLALKQHIVKCLDDHRTPILGVIDLVKLHGQLFCIDGQHRLKAISEVFAETRKEITFSCIIYNVSSFEEMKEIFQQRNYGIDMPEFLIYPVDGKDALLNDIKCFLKEAHPIIFIDKVKPNRPYVNIDKFMDYVNDSELIGSVNNVDEFKTLFYLINRVIKKKSRVVDSQTEFNKRYTIKQPMREKCAEWDCFIGLLKNTPLDVIWKEYIKVD